MTRAKAPAPRDIVYALLIGVGLFGPSHLTYYFALTRTSSVEGAVLGTTAPVFTTLMAYLILRERVSRTRSVAIGLGFVGAYVVSVGWAWPQLQSGNTLGNILYLAGVLAESTGSVFAARLIRRSSGITILAYEVVGAALVLAVAPILFPGAFPFSLTGVTWEGVAAWAYLVFVPGLLCFSVWFMLVERTPLSLMVLTLLFQPPLSALAGWWFLKEPLSAELGVGTLLILGGLVLGTRDERSARRLALAHGDHVTGTENRESE